MPAHSRDDEMLPSDVTSFLASFRKSLLTAQTALEEKVNRNAKRESCIAGLQVPHDHAEGEDSGHPQRLALCTLADSIIAKLDASLAQLLPESELISCSMPGRDLLQSHDAAQAAKIASLERCAKEARNALLQVSFLHLLPFLDLQKRMVITWHLTLLPREHLAHLTGAEQEEGERAGVGAGQVADPAPRRRHGCS